MDDRAPSQLTGSLTILGIVVVAIVVQLAGALSPAGVSAHGHLARAVAALVEQALVAGVVIVIAARTPHFTQRTRRAWLLLGAAIALLAVESAWAILSVNRTWSDSQTQTPAGSLLVLVAYMLTAASLFQMPTKPLTGKDRLFVFLDGLIIILASALVFSVLLIEPLTALATMLGPSARNYLLATTLADLFVLWIALTSLLRESASDRAPLQTIAASVALAAAGNAVWKADVLTPGAGLGEMGELLLGVSLFGFAFAAVMHRLRPPAVEPAKALAEQPSRRIQWGRYLPLICAEVAFLMPIVYVAHAGLAAEVDTFLALSVAVSIIIGLTLLRVGITLRDNYRLSVDMALIAERHQQNADALRLLKDELEQRVGDRTAEIRQVNDALKREIDERRQAQARVEEQRAFLQQVIDLNPNHIFAKDAEGRFTLVNRALAEATGHAVPDMLGKTESDLKPALPDIDRRSSDDQEVLRTGRDKIITEEMSLDRFGQPAWFHTVKRPIFDAGGSARQILGVSVDITHRKHMDDQLRRNEQHLRMITDNMMDLVTRIDRHWIVQYASPSHQTTLGYAPEDILGQSVADYLHPEEADAVIADLTQLLIERRPARRRLRIRHADRRWIWMEAIAKALLDERDRIIGLIISARDITATIEAEAALQKANQELAQAYQSTLEGWMHALDLRDKSTEGHSQRVSELTVRLAQAMNVAGEELINIRRGALLHDIGKMGVPDAVLLKPGPLDEQEMRIMRRHVDYARDILWHIPYLRPALDIPYCHHERWDGTGYPRGLRGEEIPLAARIFAVVDVWDALLSHRPYRSAWPMTQILDLIRAGAGSDFDPHVVEVFLDLCERGEIAPPTAPDNGHAVACPQIVFNTAQAS